MFNVFAVLSLIAIASFLGLCLLVLRFGLLCGYLIAVCLVNFYVVCLIS